MNQPEMLFHQIGEKLPQTIKGNMFGWQCYKMGKKPILFFDKDSNNAMVFKLNENELAEAFKLEGTYIFNPGQKSKPMKNWIVIPYKYYTQWEYFAFKSLEHILLENNS